LAGLAASLVVRHDSDGDAGTRWLNIWEKEVELFVRLVYYGLMTGRNTQTLGEEYTDTWSLPFSNHRSGLNKNMAFVVIPAFSSYILTKLSIWHLPNDTMDRILHALPDFVGLASEVNLALFYLQGTYYDLTRRLLRIRNISSIPEDPQIRPPSYSLLGVLLGVRLIYRLHHFIKARLETAQGSTVGTQNARKSKSVNTGFIDERPVDSLPHEENVDDSPNSAEEDEGTMINIPALPSKVRAERTCTLCLEERTNSCVTECGHLFCWQCIVGWGREKAECPLCRQSLSLTKIVPIYNL